MLRLLGEMSLALLAVYAVRKPVMAAITRETKSTDVLGAAYEGFKNGVEIGCLTGGSALAFPITAPIGAYELVHDVYTNREEISAKLIETKNWLGSYFVSDKVNDEVAQLEVTA